MRTEIEIINNVLNIANDDENVRAVIRTNFLPVRDYLYKYEFYFVVNNLDKYDSDKIFETVFGKRILLFRGDKNYPEMFPNTKAHLMVFNDGITITINAIDKDTFLKKYNGEFEYENVWIGDTFKKILDKDNDLPVIERLEEKQTLFSDRPSMQDFDGTCNEFWWVIKSFAEYVLRKELLSAMFYLNMPVRDLLNKMLRWFIFLNAGRPVDMGILDGRMEELLSEIKVDKLSQTFEDENLFSLYKKTYPSSDCESIWEAYDAVVKLWTIVAQIVSDKCGYNYDSETERALLEFINNLRNDIFS